MNCKQVLIVITMLIVLSPIPENLIGLNNMGTIPGSISENWDPFNQERIGNLIKTCGNEGPSWNAIKPPYAVFDWDNTSVFLDIQEATLVYQLENLIFRVTPDQL